MLTLFIGGPGDGKWRMVPDERQTYLYAEMTHAPCAAIPRESISSRVTTHPYVKQEFREGEASFFVFVHPTCKGNVFATLLKGYRQP